MEEVRRYMSDVMDNVTRAVYVLLPMRLPRRLPGKDKVDGSGDAGKSKTTAPMTRQSDFGTRALRHGVTLPIQPGRMMSCSPRV